MGSFRSEPETKKHTHSGVFDKITFAVTHMCGTTHINTRLENLHGRCSHF